MVMKVQGVVLDLLMMMKVQGVVLDLLMMKGAASNAMCWQSLHTRMGVAGS